MAKLRKRVFTDQNVLEASLDRIRYIYDHFDNVVVSFSGGKDSTAVLNLTIQVAREKGRLPVKTIFFDEEAIHPTTIEYVARVRELPEVDLEWYCLPVKHRNACSNEEPYWYCWDQKAKDRWVRPMPDYAITEHPKFVHGMSFQEFNDYLFPPSIGSVCTLDGIRTQESIRRYRVVTFKQKENYLTHNFGSGNVSHGHPIYDWSAEDVWRLVHEWGLDYNKTYDIFNRTKLYGNYNAQRVCAPFGEEPLRGLWIYAECFPEMWHKMLNRLPGVATAWRYSNTELYGLGTVSKPDHVLWEDYIEQIIGTYSRDHQHEVRKSVQQVLTMHQNVTADPIPEEDPHQKSGVSWAVIAKIAVKGDLKGRTKGMIKMKVQKPQKANS